MLARFGGADEDGAALEQVGIEGVHGLRQLGHDVIGHVHDVVDGVQADGGEPALQPQGRRLHGDVFENQRAVPRAEVEIFDLDLDRGRPFRQQIEPHRILQLAPQDGGHFARHAVVPPQVGPVRDGLVVDLDHAVGSAAGNRRPDGGFQFDDARMVAVDAQLGGAGQHAVAFHAVDHLLADGHVGADHAGPAVGRAADHRLAAVRPGVHHRLDVVAAGDRLDGFHARGAGAVQPFARHLDAFALGGLHGDELFQGTGCVIQVLDQLANPVVRELQG